jgi:hypothetical protein
LISTSDLVRAGAILALTFFVRRFHRPWPATVVLTSLLLYFDVRTGRTPVHLLLHFLIYLAVTGALFWAIDRTTHLILTLALMVTGIGVVLYFF